ncbi:MAG: gliding motility-associated C-terminal domain-containing protein, partial [Chitinophagales bacterium]
VTATYGYCTVTDTFHIGLIPAFVNATPDTTICLGESVLLNADNGDSFLWQPSASLNCDTCASPEATPLSTTSYVVTAFFASCARTDTVLVQVVVPPSFELKNDTSCNGAAVQLVAPSAFDFYSWSPSSSLSCDSCSNPFANPLVTTTYVLTVQEGPCVVTDTATVYVDQINLTAGNDTTINLGSSAQLFATGANNFLWSPSFSLDNDTSATPIATPTATTTFTVSAVSQYGCKAEAEVTVTVYDPCSHILFPTAFSPNDDGVNDFFFPMNNSALNNYDLKIFDRWGEMIFETNDPNVKWDGKYRGSSCDIGVYVYEMSALCSQKKIELNGDVTLVR